MIPLSFGPSPNPGPAVGVQAEGAAARALLERLLAADEARLTVLQGVARPGLVVLLGPFDRLPWADGVIYLGRHPDAPQLLWPTTLEPNVPPSVLEAAVAKRMGDQPSPWLLLASPPRIVSLSAALPLSSPHLRRALEAER